MARIQGKQLASDSVGIEKLKNDAGQGTVTFATGTMLGITDAPSIGTDLANKIYVDSVATGLDVKKSVRFATTGTLPAYTGEGTGTLTLTGQTSFTPDGTAVVNGDRVLVKDEGAAPDVDHGIYDVSGVGSEVVLTRSSDADADAEVTAGMFMFVTEGTTNADTGWVLVTDDTITVNTTALEFTQFTGAQSLTEGSMIDISGNTVAVDLSEATTDTIGTTDELVFSDAAGAAGNKKITLANFAETIDGDGIAANSGVLDLDINSIATTETAFETGDLLAMYDASGGNLGKITIDNFSSFQAGTQASTGLTASGGVLSTGSLYIGDKAQNPAGSSSGDNYNTTITIAATPSADSDVQVYVNGALQELGDNDSSKDCYFSSDGTEPNKRAISAIEAGDVLVWNGTSSGFDIAATDEVAFVYYN